MPIRFGVDKNPDGNSGKDIMSETVSPTMSLTLPDSSVLTMRLKEDIFCFYKLQTELPKNFFAKLGDSKVVKSDTVRAIGAFIRQEWPVFVSFTFKSLSHFNDYRRRI